MGREKRVSVCVCLYLCFFVFVSVHLPKRTSRCMSFRTKLPGCLPRPGWFRRDFCAHFQPKPDCLFVSAPPEELFLRSFAPPVFRSRTLFRSLFFVPGGAGSS